MKKHIVILLVVMFGIISNSFSQDPNFHIYLCFGQSNMEGQGTIESQDLNVNSRFKVFQALNCTNLARTKATWYTANPPTCQCYSRLSPADHFGRTMVANLPDSITIGIINVAIGGCDIRIFDKDIYMNYDSTYTESWFNSKVITYDYNPYQYLIDLALLAKQDGVIKGILLHQGETNTGNSQWPQFVKKIYDDMIADLSLSADSVPLLAGQVVSSEYGGCCSSMNTIINQLPSVLPNSYVISSSGCPDMSDNAHFNSEGYRKLGRRYAVQILSLMGLEAVYAEAECGVVGDSCIIRGVNTASNASFIIPTNGSTNSSVAPTDNVNEIQMNFTVSNDTTYYIYGRFKNEGTTKDAYWIKIDSEPYVLYDNLTTTGWEWRAITSKLLTAGAHTISIAFAEDSAMVDKFVVKNTQITPVGVGEEQLNVCMPVINHVGISLISNDGSSLSQNFPNPFSGDTSITFELPKASKVSIKVYNTQGVEVAVVTNSKYSAGKHQVTFNAKDLPSGNYYYTITTNSYSETKNMIIIEK